MSLTYVTRGRTVELLYRIDQVYSARILDHSETACLTLSIVCKFRSSVKIHLAFEAIIDCIMHSVSLRSVLHIAKFASWLVNSLYGAIYWVTHEPCGWW